MRKLIFLCLLSVVAVALPSQATHVVGPGGLPQIRDAVAIAAPGDIILVHPGTYAHFTVNVGVMMRALVPGTVIIKADPSYFGPCLGCSLEARTELAPPAGQELHVVGFNFPNSVQGLSWFTQLSITSGRVTLDDCGIGGAALGVGVTMLRIQNATVHLQGCGIGYTAYASGASGILATNATLTAVDTSIYSAGPFTNGHGLILEQSVLHGSHLTISTISESALLSIGSSVWISDSTISTYGPNDCAIDASASSTWLNRCTVTSTLGSNCSTFASATSQLAVTRPAPLQAGATFTLDWQTEPNGFVAVFAGPKLATVNWGPLLVQPSWLDHQTSFAAVLLLADGNGAATVSWPIPAGPAITGLSLWLEGLSGWTLPLQVSPVVGGIAR